MPTKMSDAGLDLVKSFEGYLRKLPNGDCTTYHCPAGVLTIGWGCTHGIHEGEVWTKEQAEEGLRKELEASERCVAKLVAVPINQNQFDALVSFDYNCGDGALGKSTLLRKLNAGDYDGAANSFAMWNKGGGRVLPGLVTRRAREAALFRTPVDAADEPAMPQKVDAPEQPTQSEQHQEAHQNLQEQSASYSWMNWIRKKLGLPVAGAAGGASLINDPASALGAALEFLKTYGLEMVAGAVVVLLFVEGFAAAQRQKVINK